jgi:hypothetical protein
MALMHYGEPIRGGSGGGAAGGDKLWRILTELQMYSLGISHRRRIPNRRSSLRLTGGAFPQPAMEDEANRRFSIKFSCALVRFSKS